MARELRLGSYVRLGRGEEVTGGRNKSSILADTLEAVIGAVYIDCGLDEASALVHRLFDPVIARAARLGAGLDWKTSLQELTAAQLLGVPEYQVEESGPDHQKSFRATVRVGGRVLGSGEGRTKKEAEQQAAEAAWKAITAEAADPPRRIAAGRLPRATAGPAPGGVTACLSCPRSRRSAAAWNTTSSAGPSTRPRAAPARRAPAPGRRGRLRGRPGRAQPGRRPAPRQVPVAVGRARTRCSPTWA